MAISVEAKESLHALREAVIKRDWIKRKEHMANLLGYLGKEKALSLALFYVENYLPIFKQRNPNEEWPEERLNEIRNEITVRPNSTNLPPYPELQRKHPDALSRTFNGGVMYHLWVAARNFNHIEKCIEYATEALSFLLSFVYADIQHRTEPQLGQYEKDPFNPERVQLVFKVRAQPDIAKFERELWLNLADEIEKRLQV